MKILGDFHDLPCSRNVENSQFQKLWRIGKRDRSMGEIFNFQFSKASGAARVVIEDETKRA